MTQQELTEQNIGQNLDDLMNLDPRGYGVCRILYKAAREYTGEPLTTHAAKELIKTVKSGDVVFIITGFVLLPFKKAEMDGVISSVLLARSLVMACGAKPVIICPTENVEAVRNLSLVVGLHLYEEADDLLKYPISMGIETFTKDKDKAANRSKALIDTYQPTAVISIEAPGANEKGEYHNAVGLNVTELEAKADVLFQKLRENGVLNIAIGDLGNEIGMGTIGEHIKKYVPYTSVGGCACGCGGGTLAASKADHIITATVSDWGGYALMAALAYLKKDKTIFHNAEMEKDAMVTAARSGVIDMYGWLIPAIDGIGATMNISLVELMRKCISIPLQLEQTCATWFEKVDELGFYDE